MKECQVGIHEGQHLWRRQQSFIEQNRLVHTAGYAMCFRSTFTDFRISDLLLDCSTLICMEQKQNSGNWKIYLYWIKNLYSNNKENKWREEEREKCKKKKTLRKKKESWQVWNLKLNNYNSKSRTVLLMLPPGGALCLTQRGCCSPSHISSTLSLAFSLSLYACCSLLSYFRPY